ncbi:MAG: hypothetical protein GKR94_13435 [Gammaproteobacteria bacterium]|nr:hypothetical protein [Gammaproteobacteria bacterium]
MSKPLTHLLAWCPSGRLVSVRYGIGVTRWRHAPRLTVLALLGLWIAAAAPAQAKSPAGFDTPLFDTTIGFDFPDARATFDEVRNLLLDKYYSRALDEQSLYYAAIKGMLRRISPPSTPEQARIWTRQEYAQVLERLTGQRTSIGIHSRYNAGDASLTVTAVTAGSPADGMLRVHDRIMRINGMPLTGMTTAALNKILRAPAAQHLQLTVVRDIEVLELEVVSDIHPIANIQTGLLPGDVAYLRIRAFTEGLSEKVRTHLERWRDAGVERLIIDLRNNSGGVFAEGLRLAELFTPSNAVLLYVAKKRKDIQRYISTNKRPFTMRLAVLVNESTASAAEAAAAALVGHREGRLVGVESFGKATIERTFTLSNEMRVRFITGAMFAPRGFSWNETGLQPALEIQGSAAHAKRWLAMPIKQRLNEDTQLRGAWQLLR